MARRVVAGVMLLILGGTLGVARGADTPAGPGSGDVPAGLKPLEYLIGTWKGTARPAANPTRGWQETHAWAWAFDKGVPAGLTLTLQGNRQLASGRLVFDPKNVRYTLDGKAADGTPVRFSGLYDGARKQLVLDREGPPPGGVKQRLTLYPNSNLIRYSLVVKEQEPGAPQFKNTIDVGLTKDGEAFAGSSAGADLPKCIITGGAAAMRVSYQGQSFPVCCSGCVDEFNADPEKYIKKASLRRAETARSPEKPRPGINKDDGAFDGLVDETPKAAATPPATNAMTRPSTPPTAAPPATKAAAPANPPATPGASSDADAERRAASALRLGENLEKRGNTAAALNYYRQVVATYPGTAAARTAARRIKALAPPK